MQAVYPNDGGAVAFVVLLDAGNAILHPQPARNDFARNDRIRRRFVVVRVVGYPPVYRAVVGLPQQPVRHPNVPVANLRAFVADGGEHNAELVLVKVIRRYQVAQPSGRGLPRRRIRPVVGLDRREGRRRDVERALVDVYRSTHDYLAVLFAGFPGQVGQKVGAARVLYVHRRAVRRRFQRRYRGHQVGTLVGEHQPARCEACGNGQCRPHRERGVGVGDGDAPVEVFSATRQVVARKVGAAGVLNVIFAVVGIAAAANAVVVGVVGAADVERVALAILAAIAAAAGAIVAGVAGAVDVQYAVAAVVRRPAAAGLREVRRILIVDVRGTVAVVVRATAANRVEVVRVHAVRRVVVREFRAADVGNAPAAVAVLLPPGVKRTVARAALRNGLYPVAA